MAQQRAPIRALEHNLLAAFEAARASSLAELSCGVDAGLVHAGIGWDTSPLPAKAPSANREHRQIVLQETFASYLWALSYSLIVLRARSEAASRRAAGPTPDGPTVRQLGAAEALFAWAIGLRATHSTWPAELPDPSGGRADAYVGQANAVYIFACVYFLFHEYTHLVQGHSAFYDGVSDAPLSDEVRVVFIELERDADATAREALLGIGSPPTEELSREFGVVIAHCAGLLLARKPAHVVQVLHPDLDNRLLAAVDSLAPEGGARAEALSTIAALACHRLLLLLKVPTDGTPADSARELLDRYLAQLDSITGRSPS